MLGSWFADDGAAIDVVDLVDGADLMLVESMVAMHHESFPDHGFVADEIRADAAVSPGRDGLVVHQWLVCRNGAPAAYVVWDANVVRRVALVHFIAVVRSGRAVRIGGERLSGWLCRLALTSLTAELAASRPGVDPLGLVGEAPERKVRLWTSVGLRPFAFPYAEPEAGRHWRTGGAAMRPLVLLWLPPPRVDAEALAPAAGAAGAAAFLLDHYGLPGDHPTVVGAVTFGDERTRPGARGR
jgi:hypothetical protein